MIRYETYKRISDEYGVDVGIAEWEGGGLVYPTYERVKDIPEDMKVVALTNFIIEHNIYQQVHRELYRLRLKIGKRKIKESTLYEKAIDIVWDNYKME